MGELLLKIVSSIRTKNIEIKKIEEFNGDDNAALERWQQSLALSAERNADILNWRFAQNKNRKYQIFGAFIGNQLAGYAVIRSMTMKGFKVMALVDLMFDPKQLGVGQALIDHIVRIAHQMKDDMVSCLMTERHPLFVALSKKLFFKTPQNFNLIVHTTDKATKQDLSKKTWHITWFDHDFV